MPVYLDHNATSPMHTAVIDAMPAYLIIRPGNPSSLHGCGPGLRQASISGVFENVVDAGVTARLARVEIDERKLHLEPPRDPLEIRSRQISGSLLDAVRRVAV